MQLEGFVIEQILIKPTETTLFSVRSQGTRATRG